MEDAWLDVNEDDLLQATQDVEAILKDLPFTSMTSEDLGLLFDGIDPQLIAASQQAEEKEQEVIIEPSQHGNPQSRFKSPINKDEMEALSKRRYVPIYVYKASLIDNVVYRIQCV